MNFLNDLKQSVIKSANFNIELYKRVGNGENQDAVFKELCIKHGLAQESIPDFAASEDIEEAKANDTSNPLKAA